MLLVIGIAGGLAACGGHEVQFVPDASNAPCGIGTWEITSTANAGTCVAQGTVTMFTIVTTWDGMEEAWTVTGIDGAEGTGSTMTDTGGCRLQGNMSHTVSGPGGAGTESDTVSVVEADGTFSGFGASSVTGGFTCNQATTLTGTYTDMPP
jgi:hypothetical protein